VAMRPNGCVGDNAWHDEHKKRIESGFVTDDMNVDFPDARLPFTGGYFSSLPTGTNYNYVLTSGNYQIGLPASPASLDLNNKTVLVTGDVVLYVTGDFNLTGNGSITIAAGAALRLHV